MNILTFDLEDWFHILDIPAFASPHSWDKLESRVEKNTDRILLLLEERKQKATWFCLGWIAKKYPSLIKKIAASHDIAIHSMEHQLVFRQKPEDVRNDIHENINLLEDLCGNKINAYRAPGFSFTLEAKWLIEILADEGLLYDCSVFPSKRNHGGFDNFPSVLPCRISYNGKEVMEFPMNKFSIGGRDVIFSGGGFFRLLPYSVISGMMKRSEYVMTYFHPRDFDPDQPMLDGLTLRRKFMSYTGLKNSFYKLNRLLNDYKFVTVEEAGRSVDWKAVALVKLDEI